MAQYDKFLTKENFKLAYTRLKTASRNLYKSIYYEDLKIFGLHLDDNIESVISSIKQDIYNPDKCHKIFIPKKDNLVRPLSMLTFIDLLIYQAITNIIADTAYEFISPYYDNIIFGNIINTSNANGENKNFFFKSWKKKWKRFNEISKEHFTKGYIFLSEFDIASFFDTIDHNILCELLKNDYHIEQDILNLLSQCLETWTADSNHKSFKSKHGIPQGPISSPFLADLYLFYIDREIQRAARKLDFKYTRYVDDIRIFSKDKLTSQKLIATLDLISRDLGLIPQGSKILIKEVIDIDSELKVQNSQFSDITKEYKEETNGKPPFKLKARTQKKLKKRFLDCFKEGSNEIYLDKTIIGFALYKLNADEEIKITIINNHHLILTHFEGILFYLKRHFPNDNNVRIFVHQILSDENILFNHLVALCFKYFPEYPFNETLYTNYYLGNHRHWLVNYYMINWLFSNNKKELILTSSSDNYFIQRELNHFKYACSQEKDYRKIFATSLLDNSNPMLSLQGIYLLFNNPSNFLGSKYKITNTTNNFISFIFSRQPTDIIVHTLKNEWKNENPETFFNRNIWTDDTEYEELRTSFMLFIKTAHSDPSKSLLNLNAFNNLVFNKICTRLSISKVSSDYGVNLNANLIATILPLCNKHWIEINEKRNQNTDAHPYDKFGNIRIRISSNDFEKLYKKQKLTLEELCNYRGY